MLSISFLMAFRCTCGSRTFHFLDAQVKRARIPLHVWEQNLRRMKYVTKAEVTVPLPKVPIPYIPRNYGPRDEGHGDGDGDA